MRKRSADPTTFAVYKEYTFYFELYTRYYAVTVATDPLSFSDNADKAKKVAEQFRDIYHLLYADLKGGVTLWSDYGTESDSSI